MMWPVLMLLLAASASPDAEDVPSHPDDLHGLALHGVYAAREADGALDCSATDQDLRVAIIGQRAIHWPDGLRTVIEVSGRRVPGPAHRYEAPQGWTFPESTPQDGASHSARLTRIRRPDDGRLGPGAGVITLRLEPDGDVTLMHLQWHWRTHAEEFLRPRGRVPGFVYAGGRFGEFRLGHCPAEG
jgi:hypothetical protein